jgi:hypothetical protein
LLHLDAWVTGEALPPASRRYFVDALNQVRVPASAAKRKGVQPVTLAAMASKHRDREDGAERIVVRRGQPAVAHISLEFVSPRKSRLPKQRLLRISPALRVIVE